MFRYKRGVHLGYNRQGYIYFTSLLYRELPQEKRDIIDELCKKCGGDDAAALKRYVTTSASVVYITQNYYLSKSKLYRLAKKYYEAFPKFL